MIQLLCFCISLCASVIGGICGIGGGVIIKPVLDATGAMSVSCVSFLSGCTVLSMALVSCIRNRSGQGGIDLRSSTPLAVGAICGGMLGKLLFDLLKNLFDNEKTVGAVQAALLGIITFATFLYTLSVSRIRTVSVRNIPACMLIGLLLGMMSSFLGIGGGPINLMVLSFFFSMDAKKAAANSLYIILLSQAAGLIQTLLSRAVPSVSWVTLGLMIAAGILGGLLGSKIHRRISRHGVAGLFMGTMGLIILINIYNFVSFI